MERQIVSLVVLLIDDIVEAYSEFQFSTCVGTLTSVGTFPSPPRGFVASCEHLGIPCYTVAFAELEGDERIVLETGDGQVSGLATTQDPAIYYQVLADQMGEVMVSGVNSCD